MLVRFPNGCDDDELPWARTASREVDTKYPYVCHAEMNAIMNKNCESLCEAAALSPINDQRHLLDARDASVDSPCL